MRDETQETATVHARSLFRGTSIRVEPAHTSPDEFGPGLCVRAYPSEVNDGREGRGAMPHVCVYHNREFCGAVEWSPERRAFYSVDGPDDGTAHLAGIVYWVAGRHLLATRPEPARA